jgi:DNA-binding transcriptional ArsR family regulator
MVAAPQFDDIIHAPTRLAIVALLAATEWAEFAFIRDSVQLSDSALSKQLAILETTGYVAIRKSFVGKRPRTSARLSQVGRSAFERHLAALQEIVALARSAVQRGDAEAAPGPVHSTPPDKHRRRLPASPMTH